MDYGGGNKNGKKHEKRDSSPKVVGKLAPNFDSRFVG